MTVQSKDADDIQHRGRSFSPSITVPARAHDAAGPIVIASLTPRARRKLFLNRSSRVYYYD